MGVGPRIVGCGGGGREQPHTFSGPHSQPHITLMTPSPPGSQRPPHPGGWRDTPSPFLGVPLRVGGDGGGEIVLSNRLQEFRPASPPPPIWVRGAQAAPQPPPNTRDILRPRRTPRVPPRVGPPGPEHHWGEGGAAPLARGSGVGVGSWGIAGRGSCGGTSRGTFALLQPPPDPRTPVLPYPCPVLLHVVPFCPFLPHFALFCPVHVPFTHFCPSLPHSCLVLSHFCPISAHFSFSPFAPIPAPFCSILPHLCRIFPFCHFAPFCFVLPHSCPILPIFALFCRFIPFLSHFNDFCLILPCFTPFLSHLSLFASSCPISVQFCPFSPIFWCFPPFCPIPSPFSPISLFPTFFPTLPHSFPFPIPSILPNSCQFSPTSPHLCPILSCSAPSLPFPPPFCPFSPPFSPFSPRGPRGAGPEGPRGSRPGSSSLVPLWGPPGTP